MAKVESKNIQEKFYNNLGFIAVLIVTLIYVGWGLAVLVPKGDSILTILTEAALSLTLGFTIKNILKYQGIIGGENSEKFQASLQHYGSVLEASVPIFSVLPEFTDHKNKIAFKSVRTNLLQRVGLVYSDYFDGDGRFIGPDIKTPQKTITGKYKGISDEELTVYKCLTLKITMLTADDLTSDVENETSDPLAMGKTKREWQVEGAAKQLVMQIITALIFGYYGLDYVSNLNKGMLIWKLVQIGLFILIGLFQLIKGYQFIIGPYRNRIIKKANLLEEAQIWSKNARHSIV